MSIGIRAHMLISFPTDPASGNIDRLRAYCAQQEFIMSSQFRLPLLQQKTRRKHSKKPFGTKKSGVHQNQMGAQGLKMHNKRVIDMISKVITLMQQYFLLAERVQNFIKKSH